MDVSQLIQLNLTQIQIYALVFLLGSFTVAALSDIKHMKAQREFIEVWYLVIFILLIYDVFHAYETGEWEVPLIKWGLIILFSIISHNSIGGLFHLAGGDVAACVAVSVLLSPLFIIIFFITLKILNFILRPFLKITGDKHGYPFMPIILIGTLVCIGISFYMSQ